MVETDYTSEIVCPHCGYVHSDSWEAPDEDDEYQCGECLKTFAFRREIDVNYTSWKVKQ